MKLVIVESPTKAKTIQKFLGKSYSVQSSFGHVRDLPVSKLGVDVDHDFAPSYVVPTKAKKTVSELKALAKKADTIYFATDEDREGEAISWHLANILKVEPKDVERVAFHEITEHAIKEAFSHPRHLDENLVDAQQARRILDRLVGYKLSPLLWRKITKGLSAGRVQSVAVRLIVDREREITAFKPDEYWTIEAQLSGDAVNFGAKLWSINDKKLEKLDIKTKEDADKILGDLKGAEFKVADIEEKDVKRSPGAPYRTSTLQQDANRKLNMSAKASMMFAQRLYEIGFITYMRTDSENLSEKFIGEADEFIKKEYGSEYATGGRTYATKNKGAQEAHEAVRATDPTRTPDSVKNELEPDQLRLYDLIWRRSVGSQMADAVLESTRIDIEAINQEINKSKNQNNNYIFRATGSVVKFPGFLALTKEEPAEGLLPKVKVGEKLNADSVEGKQHFTEPPPRFSDASLVKIMEENGIGRPSTYAPTIATIVDRNYVERIEGRRLKPTELAFLVNDLLVEHFPEIVDFAFTAKKEAEFDEIAEGKIGWVPVIREFWEPFAANLAKKEIEIKREDIIQETTTEVCDKCSKPMSVKFGRFGKFLACTGYPECKNTKPMGGEKQIEIPEESKKCPTCGADTVIKRGRFGPFIACSKYPECKTIINIEKKVGVKCPKCGEGDLVERKSKRGKPFYSCNKYPKCEFALWSKPTGEKCPKCQSLLVHAKKGVIGCSSKECDYTLETPENSSV
ncbi:MAG: type I DNA topoisomerase [bacterium]